MAICIDIFADTHTFLLRISTNTRDKNQHFLDSIFLMVPITVWVDGGKLNGGQGSDAGWEKLTYQVKPSREFLGP